MESSAPPPYDRHVGRYGERLARGLIEFAGVASGQRVLDVGCGAGKLTAALSELAGVRTWRPSTSPRRPSRSVASALHRPTSASRRRRSFPSTTFASTRRSPSSSSTWWTIRRRRRLDRLSRAARRPGRRLATRGLLNREPAAQPLLRAADDVGRIEAEGAQGGCREARLTALVTDEDHPAVRPSELRVPVL